MPGQSWYKGTRGGGEQPRGVCLVPTDTESGQEEEGSEESNVSEGVSEWKSEWKEGDEQQEPEVKTHWRCQSTNADSAARLD